MSGHTPTADWLTLSLPIMSGHTPTADWLTQMFHFKFQIRTSKNRNVAYTKSPEKLNE